MKILFVTSRLPHERVISGHHIVHQRIVGLAQRGHQVGIASFLRTGDQPYLAGLQKLVPDLQTVQDPREAPWWRQARRTFGVNMPSLFADYYHPDFDRLVGDMLEAGGYEIAIAEGTVMGQYLFRNPCLPAVRTVISCHRSPTLANRLLSLRMFSLTAYPIQRYIREYEFRLYRSCDRVLTLKAEELYGLLSYAPDLRVTMIPCGVDTEFFALHPRPDPIPRLVFTGNYADPSNSDAVIWFCRQVWQDVKLKHPDAVFHVIGPNSTPAMRQWIEGCPDVVVEGEVDDVRPWLARAWAFVCPIRVGAGMRMKVLEAMASGVPVIATTHSLEGIPAHTSQNCLIADDANFFAQQISLLLSDRVLREKISHEARRMVERSFGLKDRITDLERVFVEILEKSDRT